MLDLASQAEKIVWECIEIRIIIDDIEKGVTSQYWTTLKEKLEKSKKSTINIQN